MKNKKVIRLFTAMLAVVLCMTAFSVTAFAGGGDGDYYTGEPTETTPEPTEEPATGGMEPEGHPLTPEGNATLVDDYYGDKQLITVTTKAGNYFYILIDRANEDKETAVHFLNQVDEADLMALLEDGQTEKTPAACTCAEKCQAGAVNTACPVCAVNMSECAGKAPEVEPEPEPEPEKESGSGGALVLILLLAALGGGGAFAYIKFIKPKQGAKVSADPDDYEFEDEEYQEALKRKAEIESQKSSNSFLPPTNQNIAEFLSDFVSLYGEKRWGVSMYDSQNSLIANYINPIIGDMKVQDITTRVVDKYIQTLQKTPAVNTRTHHAKTEFVTNATIEKIIKLLRCAFKQAVRWELVAKNPFDNVVLPKVEYKKRDIWTADMIRTALDQCTDSKLYVAMNLAFACSLRMGEILGLTWSNVHISDEDIADDNAYVYIDKELARASKRAIEMLGQKDIYHVFTPLFPNTSTRIILKKPKTDSSIRKVWLPKTLAYILREWKSAQDELRALLRDEYQDYNLVVALANGRPCEDRIILKSFEKLREKAGLPKVVFHSLRHSSTTYKLKLNHGDLKATQGDTGHAQIDMITSVYAHILDEDRKINAQKFESAFYANPDLRSVRPPEEPKEPAPATLDLESLVEQLRKSPELANTLAALLASAPSEK